MEAGRVVGLLVLVLCGAARTTIEEVRASYSKGCTKELAAAEVDGAPDQAVLDAGRCFLANDDEANTDLWLGKAADRDMAEGLRYYGNFLYALNKTEKAESMWERGVELGDVECESNLGMALIRADDVERGFAFIKSAAEKDEPTALFNYGSMLDTGVPEIDIPADKKAALSYLMRSAKLGHSSAMMALANKQRDKRGRLKKSALSWLKKALAAGDFEAAALMGYMYKMGEGVGVDEDKSFEHYMKAAEAGHPSSQYEIGNVYAQDTGVEERDLEKARYWLQRAADQGHGYAMHNLANVILSETRAKSNKEKAEDEKLALSLYAAAATQGTGESLLLLGRFHLEGRYGLEVNVTLSARYWGQGARLGHTKCQQHLYKLAYGDKEPEAMYEMALTFMEDDLKGIDQDLEAAAELFDRAAGMGHAGAQKKSSRWRRDEKKRREEEKKKKKSEGGDSKKEEAVGSATATCASDTDRDEES